MGILDYKKAASKFKGEKNVLEILACLRDFDEFHCLRDSNLLLAGKVENFVASPPKDYIKWMTICNGGLLFDTTLLSVDAYDKALEVEFSTLEDYNTPAAHQEFMLPEGFSIIGLRSYGDPICVSASDSRVYLWNCEAEDFTTIWDSFFDFLADDINEAMELIANEDLEPIPLKLEGGAGQ